MMLDSSTEVVVTGSNFREEVLEKSKKIPVLLLFWTAQMRESAEQRQQLLTMTAPYAARLSLATMDVALEPAMAQNMRIRALPTVKAVHQGEVVNELNGPQDEASLRALINQLTMSSAEQLKPRLAQFIDDGDFKTAMVILQQALDEEPDNAAFQVELADLQVRSGQLDEARQTLQGIPEETADRKRPEERLVLMEEVADLTDAATATARLEADAKDLEAYYIVAIHHLVEGQFETAMESLLKIIRQDRTYRDELGRKTMIRVFNLLGEGHPLASRYRRKLFNSLH